MGLSGGVDSAVTAALLQKAGAHVTGIFIKGWYPPALPCTWTEDRRDAMRVAARLQIPFVTLDASQAYKQSVIDYLIAEYRAGRTPNPDIMCNKDVKFGVGYDYARNHGADYFATGHYAQVEDGIIRRGVDSGKDQSYFLWAIPKEALSHILFPLGGMKKEDVRKLARAWHLPVAEKKDSQGICFLGAVSIEDFLRTEVGLTPGRAVDENGNDVGTHEGAIAYTLGERVSLVGGAIGPWYVVRKDVATNTLTVSHTPAPSQERGTSVTLSQTHLLTTLSESTNLTAQYRYHGPVISGTLSSDRKTYTPTEPLLEPVAQGQSLVFYDGNTLIGGGIIE